MAPESEMDTETETVAKGAEREAEAADTTETATTGILNWKRVVALVQAEFGEVRLADDATR